MNHLKLIQNTNIEVVGSAVIEKLYNIFSTQQLDSTSTLEGNLLTSGAYRDAVEYLTTRFSPKLNISVSNNNYYVRFVDEAVKNLIVQYFAVGYTDIPESLAANITSDQMFNATINGTSNSSIFASNTDIQYVDLSPFTSLTYLTANGNTNKAFNKTTNLKYINTGSVTEISTSISGAYNTTSFMNSGLEVFYGPNITLMQNAWVFKDATNLVEVYLPKIRQLLDGLKFRNNPALELVVLGNNVEQYHMDTFSQVNSSSTISLVINASTPPTAIMSDGNNTSNVLLGNNRYGKTKIYVPDSAVDAYKAADGWSLVSTIIYPISELSTTNKDRIANVLGANWLQ